MLAKLANERFESTGRKGTPSNSFFWKDDSAASVATPKLKPLFLGLEMSDVADGTTQKPGSASVLVVGAAEDFRPTALLKLEGFTPAGSDADEGFDSAEEKTKPDGFVSETADEAVDVSFEPRVAKPDPNAGMVKVALGGESMLANDEVCCVVCSPNRDVIAE